MFAYSTDTGSIYYPTDMMPYLRDYPFSLVLSTNTLKVPNNADHISNKLKSLGILNDFVVYPIRPNMLVKQAKLCNKWELRFKSEQDFALIDGLYRSNRPTLKSKRC